MNKPYDPYKAKTIEAKTYADANISVNLTCDAGEYAVLTKYADTMEVFRAGEDLKLARETYEAECERAASENMQAWLDKENI